MNNANLPITITQPLNVNLRDIHFFYNSMVKARQIFKTMTYNATTGTLAIECDPSFAEAVGKFIVDLEQYRKEFGARNPETEQLEEIYDGKVQFFPEGPLIINIDTATMPGVPP